MADIKRFFVGRLLVNMLDDRMDIDAITIDAPSLDLLFSVRIMRGKSMSTKVYVVYIKPFLI